MGAAGRLLPFIYSGSNVYHITLYRTTNFFSQSVERNVCLYGEGTYVPLVVYAPHCIIIIGRISLQSPVNVGVSTVAGIFPSLPKIRIYGSADIFLPLYI